MMLEKRKEAQQILIDLINQKLYSKKELSEILKMSYPTFTTRYENVEWRAKEIEMIFDKFKTE